MVTSLVSVQIIISLLKQHGVKKLVLSPGNRDVPLVHSVETDPDFECFSIVDERSAAYFALGLSEATGEAVGFACTSSTASCNYMPAIEEAARKGLPLIALTADRENYLLYQFEDQKIHQSDMYEPYTKYCADLPVVRSDLDRWLCIRKTNEALLAAMTAPRGPVQINFQVDRTDRFFTKTLPVYRKIEKLSLDAYRAQVETVKKQLSSKQRILVVVGECYGETDALSKLLHRFEENYSAVVLSSHFCNFEDDFLKTIPVIETMTGEDFEKFAPDLVITLGGHIWSAVKYRLRASGASFEHWRISDDGVVRDGFKRLNRIFDFSPEAFFEPLLDGKKADRAYYESWKKKCESISYPALGFTNFYAIGELAKCVPTGALVHTSILNSARLSDFARYGGERIRSYCNFGCDGIDGCLSSFLGQAKGHDGVSLLITGDLSFLYDLNATLEPMGKNTRIFLVNNHAGSEFHTLFGLEKFETLNLHIAAGHETNVSDTLSDSRFRYLSASNEAELKEGLQHFFEESDRPVVFEVFTDADRDGKTCKAFYAKNQVFSKKTRAVQFAKSLVKRILYGAK